MAECVIHLCMCLWGDLCDTLLSINRPLITGVGMKFFNSNDNSTEVSHPRVPTRLFWTVGIALLLAWTAGWAAFSSQVHTGWLAVRIDHEEGGSIPVHDIIAMVMILLGWLFGLGAIVSYSPRAQQKESQPKWKSEVAYCPKCHRKLRTSLAKQCLLCGADWH